MPITPEIFSIVQAACKHGDPLVDESSSPTALKIPVEDLHNVCQELLQDSATYFDMLSCITAIDNGVAASTIEVVYNLYSIPYNLHLMLKVALPREKPEVETVSNIWKTANWHEREAFEMFGVYFKNHPDLRHLLLPADWEGYPLRKDYQQQEYYRNIKVSY